MNERSIFMQALDLDDPREQEAYVRRACGGDDRLRERVEALIRAHRAAGSFVLDRGLAADLAATVDAPTLTERPGSLIGPYKLLEVIGEGGMGVVSMAEQTHPVRRKVALKLIKPGMDTRQVIARFEAERQALALMDHPNIARVLDAGATESGRPYFVMELVRGIPITDYCDRARLPIPARLELFVQVCQAVQHAHQKGIIHRDLKPTNVLVTLHDGVPVPKVIDFGIAKATGPSLTDKTLFTGFAQLVGTPLYMSPEQAEMSGLDIDTRSDIYSLGVLLYELMTGTTPFDEEALRKAAFDEVQRIIRHEEPPTPSTRLGALGATLTTVSAKRGSDPRRLVKAVRGELDWIVMKALEKDRNRRYETASGLASDVRRYLDDEPVEACPPSAWYRLSKTAHRHRAALVTSAVVATALVLGTAVSVWQAVRATAAHQGESRARLRAEGAEKVARAEADIAQAVTAFLTEDLLNQAEPAKTAAEDHVSLLEVLDRAGAKVGDRFADQPEVEDALRRMIAGTYHGLASWEKAERQWRAVLEAARRRHGAESREALTAQGALAHILRHRGRTDAEALEMARSASEGLTRVLGPDHPDTLESRVGLAEAYRAAGRIAEAIARFEATLKVMEATLGPDHPSTLACRNGLAEAYLAAGRIAEAIARFEATLKVMEATLGPDHPSTLAHRHRLAEAYLFAGRTAEAIPLLEATLKVMEVKLGPDHPSTLGSRNGLAKAYRAAGRTAEAIPLLEATLKQQESKLGPDHPSTLVSRGSLAGAYGAVGLTAKSIELQEATLKGMESKLGPNHRDTLVIRNNLAAAYWRAGRLDRSLPLYESTLKRVIAAFGPDHPYTLRTRANLGVNYRDAGRPEEGARLMEEALERARGRPDAMSQLGWVPPLLAAAYDASSQFARSEPLYREGLEQARKAFGPADPRTAAVTAQLGMSLLRQKKWAEAEPVLRACLAAREKAEPDDWSPFNTRSMLGEVMLGRGRYAEAEPLIIAGYEGMRARESKIPPPGRPRLSEAAGRVIRLYEAWGKPEQAAAWKAKLGLLDLPADVFARPGG